MGGYQIIDFKGIPLAVAGDAVEIPGIYAIVADNHSVYRSATLIHNLKVGDVHYPDFYATIELDETDGNDYKFVSHGTQTVTIGEGDLVKVTE